MFFLRFNWVEILIFQKVKQLLKSGGEMLGAPPSAAITSLGRYWPGTDNGQSASQRRRGETSSETRVKG